jgi:hypothetical protein
MYDLLPIFSQRRHSILSRQGSILPFLLQMLQKLSLSSFSLIANAIAQRIRLGFEI